MPLELSPEALEQIRQVVESVVAGRFATVDQRLGSVDQRFDQLRTEIRDGLEQNRRHFGVVAEELKSKLDLVIEGFNRHDQRMDRIEREMRDGFAQVDRRLIAISAHMPRQRDS